VLLDESRERARLGIWLSAGRKHHPKIDSRQRPILEHSDDRIRFDLGRSTRRPSALAWNGVLEWHSGFPLIADPNLRLLSLVPPS
jgi:hypothetical protein